MVTQKICFVIHSTSFKQIVQFLIWRLVAIGRVKYASIASMVFLTLTVIAWNVQTILVRGTVKRMGLFPLSIVIKTIQGKQKFEDYLFFFFWGEI